MSYCKADPKSIPKVIDAAAKTNAAAAAAATAHAASLSVGPGAPSATATASAAAAAAAAAGAGATGTASSNWKLDEDGGSGGVKMDSTNRANIMSRFGGTAGEMGSITYVQQYVFVRERAERGEVVTYHHIAGNHDQYA